MVNPTRFSVWGVELSPTRGSEQAGYRPVVILSPDVMNVKLRTVIVAPMTTALRGWPTRVSVNHGGKNGEIALDQIRTIDKSRLKKEMGSLQGSIEQQILGTLVDIFSP